MRRVYAYVSEDARKRQWHPRGDPLVDLSLRVANYGIILPNICS